MLSLPDDLANDSCQPSQPVQLQPSRRLDLSNPSGYRPSSQLVDAIKVALLLRKPLLVTGEPGTGKTDLGQYLAWKMNFLFFKFEAKSTSQARDLYYTYDALGRFQSAQAGGEKAPGDKPAEKVEARNFIHFNALGEAILDSIENNEAVQKLLPPDFLHQGPRQSVVVIDEIDKAPRDFPNDLLNELEQSYFRIPELGNPRIDAKKGLEPFVVVTSNSEKNLPAPFLRRCVYFHIDFPKDLEKLRSIVSGRIGEFRNGASPLLNDTLDLFTILRRDSTSLTKKPATAELLDWMLALLAVGAPPTETLREHSDRLFATLPALIKHESDLEPARTAAQNWLDAATKKP